MASPATDLLTTLQRAGGQPRATWYGPESQRVELSGAVAANWVIKQTNFLIEEVDVTLGTRVAVDLPVHWRTPLWDLAVWVAGACLDPDHTHSYDVVVTDRPARWLHGRHQVVAVPLPALPAPGPRDVPAGVFDAAEATSMPDVLTAPPAHAPTSRAVAALSGAVSFDALAHWWRAGSVAPSGQADGRVALFADASVRDPQTVEAYVATVCDVWARGGSVVVIPADHPDPARTCAAEQVTATATLDTGQPMATPFRSQH